jgi:uncharacterized RDD family membrane protein YckC
MRARRPWFESNAEEAGRGTDNTARPRLKGVLMAAPSPPDNPDRAPKARLVDTDTPADLRPAGRWRRSFGYWIDYLAFSLMIFALGMLIALVGSVEALESIDGIWTELAFSIAAFFGYYVVSERLTGRTIGKLVTGTRVVNDGGARPNFKQVLGRSACRIIPLEALAIFGDEKLCLHDSLARTRVVRV